MFNFMKNLWFSVSIRCLSKIYKIQLKLFFLLLRRKQIIYFRGFAIMQIIRCLCFWRGGWVERLPFKTDQCLCSSWWWFPTEKQAQNQSLDSHLVIFDWNSKNWLDGGTARSLAISCCVKASEQNPHTKPDLLPNVSRNEAALCRGGVVGELSNNLNSQQSREVTQVKVQKAEWLIFDKMQRHNCLWGNMASLLWQI